MEDPDLHLTKRRRTETLTPSPPSSPGKGKAEVAAASSPPASKGKEKVENDGAASSPPPITEKGKEKIEDGGGDAEEVCGICLLEGGRAVRGRIDSCDHLFCFVCIMEWAKIESRCPMCKGRFAMIYRPQVPGVFPCERVVVVPHRNQVYHPLGNESTALSDPYTHTSCNTCNSSANENLLLLCDLCDAAAHTYCVGLGSTVPEGDWYCSDCTISREEHRKTQSEVDSCNQYSPVRMSQPPPVRMSQPSVLPSGVASNSSQSFSTFSTLQARVEQREDEISFRNTSHTTHQPVMLNKESSPSVATTDRNTRSSTHPPDGIASRPTVSIFEIVSEEPRNGNRLPTRRTLLLQTSPTVSVVENNPSSRPGVDNGTRTLGRCRNLQGRIRELRENWNALRAGSASFSLSSSKGSGTTCNPKLKKNVTRPSMSGLSDSTSVNNVQSTSDANASSEKHNCRGPKDVNRAWKMMEIAKSIPTKRSAKSIPCDNSNRNRSGSSGTHNVQSSSLISKGNISSHKEAGKCQPQNIEKPESITKMKDVQRTCSPSGNNFLSGHSESAQHPKRSTICSPCVKRCASNGAENLQSSSFISKDDISAHKVVGKCQSQTVEKQKSDTKMEVQKICRASENSLISGYSESTSTKQNKSLLKDDDCNGKEETTGQLLLRRAPASFDKRSTQVYPGSSASSLPEASCLSSAKCIEFECSKVEPRKRIDGEWIDDNGSSIRRASSLKSNNTESIDVNSVGRSRTANNNDKEEVQSLVKLNLKLLSRNWKLDNEQFKEIARASTHTILAACGFDVRSKLKTSFSSSSSICQHTKEIKLVRKSSLMPDSCRECFYTFVKNVVDSVLTEKIQPKSS